jgi:hypothetical protein
VLELLWSDVDRDDRLRAGEQSTLDDGEPDAAAADHGHRRAFTHGRRPERGSGAGREAAREQCRLLDRQLLRHLHRARLVDDRVVGERPAPENRRQQRTVGRAVQAPLRAQL